LEKESAEVERSEAETAQIVIDAGGLPGRGTENYRRRSGLAFRPDPTINPKEGRVEEEGLVCWRQPDPALFSAGMRERRRDWLGLVAYNGRPMIDINSDMTAARSADR